MRRARLILALVATALLLAACGGGEGATTTAAGPDTGPDMVIERRVGYAVVVDETAGRLLIGFSPDRNATSGDSYDISQAVWRVESGLWSAPPTTCVTVGKRLELGVADVQNANQPGLLYERVIWLSCLPPAGD
jgi:hypothetical protein